MSAPAGPTAQCHYESLHYLHTAAVKCATANKQSTVFVLLQPLLGYGLILYTQSD